MKKIALLSDTHGHLDESILTHCRACDEIWHAGDFGTVEVSDRLASIVTLRGVYGNIDGQTLRQIHPKVQHFFTEEVVVLMVHIGGYPGHYTPGLRELIVARKPDLLITGHAHILKIMRDEKYGNLLFINPGAAGKQGFHNIRTMVTFRIDRKNISDLQVIELGRRETKSVLS